MSPAAWRARAAAWTSRLVFTIVAAGLTWAVVAAATTSPVAAPAVRWGRVAAEQVVAAVLG